MSMPTAVQIFFVRVFRHFSAVHHTETNLLKISLEIEVMKIIFNLLET